jgi:hypothetical protein
MSHDTVIFDVGESILGLWSVRRGKFLQYPLQDFAAGADLLSRAKRIVSYNGKRYDVPFIEKALGLPTGKLPLSGIHIDMHRECWGNILGRSLRSTYFMHFSELPVFPNTYEGSNRCDVHMTLKLWECLVAGNLCVRNGAEVGSPCKSGA